MNRNYVLCLLLSLVLLFTGCAREDNTKDQQGQDSTIDSSSAGESSESEETPEESSREDSEEQDQPWASGVFVIRNGNEIQNGPNQKGIHPLLATLVFYEDGTFYFNFDSGLSAGGFSGNYEVKEGQIIAESSTSVFFDKVYLVFNIADEDTLIFVEDQGGNQHYYINKARQLQAVSEGDAFIRSGESIEEAEERRLGP